MSFWNETKARWSANMPTYFKKLKNLGVGFSATGGSFLAGPAALPPSVHFPELLAKIGGYLLVAGIAIGGVAKLTCSDASDLPNQKP